VSSDLLVHNVRADTIGGHQIEAPGHVRLQCAKKVNRVDGSVDPAIFALQQVFEVSRIRLTTDFDFAHLFPLLCRSGGRRGNGRSVYPHLDRVGTERGPAHPAQRIDGWNLLQRR